METVKALWLGAWKVAIAVGFASLGVFGVGLLIGLLWYPTGFFWSVVVFLMGVLGILLAIGAALTVRNRPQTALA